MACNFNNSRRDLDSAEETSSLERGMTMLVKRESKISMFKVVKLKKMNKTI